MHQLSLYLTMSMSFRYPSGNFADKPTPQDIEKACYKSKMRQQMLSADSILYLSTRFFIDNSLCTACLRPLRKVRVLTEELIGTKIFLNKFSSVSVKVESMYMEVPF